MKVLFAHNTLSSYKPCNWIGKLFNPWAKCQNKSIKELYEEGVRGFDIRLRCSEDWLIPCHGIVDYDVDINAVFSELKALSKYKDEQIYIRIINEDTFHSSSTKQFNDRVGSLISWFPEFKYQVYYSKKLWLTSIDEFEEIVFELCASKLFPLTPKYVSNKNKWQYLSIFKQLRKGFLFLDFI